MRVKRGTDRKDRRKKILKLAEGYWGGNPVSTGPPRSRSTSRCSTPIATASSASATSAACGSSASTRRHDSTA